jgi:hypothetical protein
LVLAIEGLRADLTARQRGRLASGDRRILERLLPVISDALGDLEFARSVELQINESIRRNSAKRNRAA